MIPNPHRNNAGFYKMQLMANRSVVYQTLLFSIVFVVLHELFDFSKYVSPTVDMKDNSQLVDWIDDWKGQKYKFPSIENEDFFSIYLTNKITVKDASNVIYSETYNSRKRLNFLRAIWNIWLPKFISYTDNKHYFKIQDKKEIKLKKRKEKKESKFKDRLRYLFDTAHANAINIILNAQGERSRGVDRDYVAKQSKGFKEKNKKAKELKEKFIAKEKYRLLC